MSLYLDSSVTVSAVSAERATARVLDWVESAKRELVLSDWVTTETSAAMTRKLRMKLVSQEEHLAGLAAFDRLFLNSLPVLDVSRGDFRRAAMLARSAEAALRAGDALHLAIAERHEATLCTLDRGQAAAGETLGIPILLL